MGRAPSRDDVLRAYVEVWNEPDAARRAALLAICWSETSEIVGPGYHFLGRRAVLDEIARFRRDDPGFRVAPTSGFDGHGDWARFTFDLRGVDGAVVNRGWDVVAFAADGRIARVITFWGDLPSAPDPRAAA